VRLANKARLYGAETDANGHVIDEGGNRKLDIEEVVGMYRDCVIPLTKDVEVRCRQVDRGERLTK
jgi:chorismate mutase